MVGLNPLASSAGVVTRPLLAPLDSAAGKADGGATSRTSASAEELGRTLDNFRKEATKTPAERMREQVLKEMELTEDDIKAMSGEERKTVEQQISDEVVRRLRMARENETGSRKTLIELGIA